jgi:hypothetical protein
MGFCSYTGRIRFSKDELLKGLEVCPKRKHEYIYDHFSIIREQKIL